MLPYYRNNYVYTYTCMLVVTMSCAVFCFFCAGGLLIDTRLKFKEVSN